MAKCKLLAFLLCEDATKARDGKVTLHGLFDRIIIPHTRREVKVFFVFYKVVVIEPCTVTLRVIDPDGNKIPEDYWRDSLAEFGPMQAVWPLSSNLFKHPGPYALELMQENGEAEPLSLASMTVVVDQQGD
jgi:hypothetical protein